MRTKSSRQPWYIHDTFSNKWSLNWEGTWETLKCKIRIFLLVGTLSIGMPSYYVNLIISRKKFWILSILKGLFDRPFPSSPGRSFKTRVGAQPLIWKSFFILMQIKLIFTRKVAHLASFWKWGFLELGSGLLKWKSYSFGYRK